MRKLLFAAFLMLSVFTTFAQKNIPKGSLLFGGDLFYRNSTYKDNGNNKKETGFTVSPAAGIAVKDNLFVGLNLTYGYAKNTGAGIGLYYDSTRVNTYGANLYLRKYKPLKNNFYLFLQGGLGFTSSGSKLDKGSARDYSKKDFNVSLGVSPGLSYAINSKIQIETGFNNIFGIGYSESIYRDNAYFAGQRKSTGFNAYTTLNNFNSQIYIGFRLLLQKKTRSA